MTTSPIPASPQRRLRSVTSTTPNPETGPRIVHHPGGSIPSRLLAAGVAGTVKPFVAAWARAPHAPWLYPAFDYAGLLLKPVPGTRTNTVTLADRTTTRTTTSRASQGRVVLYLHGGAFLIGGRHLHRQLLSRISQLTRATVYAPAYRQLPNHPVPVSVTDAVAAYAELLEQGHDPAQVVIMGDSAGGYLTLAAAAAIRDAHLPAPAALVAMSPLDGFDPGGRATAPTAKTCAMFPAAGFRSLARVAATAARRHNRRHGANLPDLPDRISDLDLAGLPPVLVQASTAESLLPDAVDIVHALHAAGVDSQLHTWNGQIHVFQAAADLVPEAREALTGVAEFVDRACPTQLRLINA